MADASLIVASVASGTSIRRRSRWTDFDAGRIMTAGFLKNRDTCARRSVLSFLSHAFPLAAEELGLIPDVPARLFNTRETLSVRGKTSRASSKKQLEAARIPVHLRRLLGR